MPRLRSRRRVYTTSGTPLQSKHAGMVVATAVLAPDSLHWQRYIETKDVEVPGIYICILTGSSRKLRSASSSDLSIFLHVVYTPATLYGT